MLKSQMTFLITLTVASVCCSNPDSINYLENKLIHEIIDQKSVGKAVKEAQLSFNITTLGFAAIGVLLGNIFPGKSNSRKKNAEKRLDFVMELNFVTMLIQFAYSSYANTRIAEKEKTLEAIQKYKAKNASDKSEPLDLQTFYQTLKAPK